MEIDSLCKKSAFFEWVNFSNDDRRPPHSLNETRMHKHLHFAPISCKTLVEECVVEVFTRFQPAHSATAKDAVWLYRRILIRLDKAVLSS